MRCLRAGGVLHKEIIMKAIFHGFGLAVVGVVVLCIAGAIVYGMATVVKRATLCYNAKECIEETGKGMQPILHLFGGS